MSRDQNHSHFQQRNLVGKLEPANILNEVNYRRHGFDGRGAALSSLDLSRPSMGLDQRMPSLNLDRRDLDRRGTVPPRPSSMLSDGGSATSLESSPRNEEAGSPENRIAALEEEKHEESFDEGMGNILAESPCCNICNHSFTDTADFVNHVKLHFGGPGKTNSNKRKAVDEVGDYSRKRHSPTGQETTSPSRQETISKEENKAMPRMNSSTSRQQQRSPVNSNDQMIAFTSPEEPEEDLRSKSTPQTTSSHTLASSSQPPRRHQGPKGVISNKSPPPPQTISSPAAGSHPHNILELFTNQQLLHQQQQQQQQQLQAAAHFNPFNPFLPQYNPHQQTGFPPPAPPGHQVHPVHSAVPHYPFGSLLPQSPPTFKCPWCPAVFDNRDVMLHHMQLHQLPQNGHQSPYTNINSTATSQHDQGQRLRASPPTTCGANCTCAGCVQSRGRKTKKVVEDIDVVTLKKVEKLEWERKHGYWCKKCNKRFASQMKLVDHMSSPEHNNLKTPRLSNSGATSPAGSNQSNPSPTPSL